MESHQLILSVLLFCLFYPSYASSGRIQHGVVGGQEAKPHSRPYMVYVKIGDSNCGGTLITPEWVLTAAHCYGNIVAILGAHDVKQPEDSQQVIGIKSYHMHPEYNDDDDNLPFNDALLLRLSSKATINHYVQTIALPTSSSDLPTGTHCSISGWGMIDSIHNTEKLFEANVTIVSRRLCKRYFPQLSDGMICAGSIHQMRDTSQGDSGGPLVCGGVVEGIVSFGFDHPPGVYARVGKYLNWIKETISRYGDNTD